MENINRFTIEEIDKKIDEFSKFDDARESFEYYKELKHYMEETSLKQADSFLYEKFYKRMIKLKFLALNFIDDWAEIEELIKNHFEVIYGINYYDLWNKIKTNLLAVPALADRDKIKENIRKILLECSRPIIDIKKYKNTVKLPVTVAEWLKNYIANLGNNEVDNFKRIEYLTNGENMKSLAKEDKDKVKILFDLYESLKYPSSSRKGFEADIPMTINNKLYIFTGGEAEEVSSNVIDLIKKIKVDNVKNKSDDQAAERKPIVSEKIREDKELTELKQLAASFPPGSFERKAVEEEIGKWNKES